MAAAGAAGALVAGREEDDPASMAARKRYEGLVAVQSKGMKGKGAWYWAHLDPILLHTNPESGTPTTAAVKLRCCLCNAIFSASNPSRTASEHLKPGTCPNFSAAIARPPPAAPHPDPDPDLHPHALPYRDASSSGSSRKRGPAACAPAPAPAASAPHSIKGIRASPDGIRINSSPFLLSGGREDIEALTLLEDSVKKLRATGLKGGPAVEGLSKGQTEASLNLLAEWLYESCGQVSLNCVEHPKFRAFLAQLGLPAVSGGYLAGARLDTKYMEVKAEADAKLKDALFFQFSLDGWKKGSGGKGECLVDLTLNLPNGSSLFYKVVHVNAASLCFRTVEEILEEAISRICNGAPERCVGIVADADKCTAKALRELEFRYCWMVNLPCQAKVFGRLLKDFSRHLALFTSVRSECSKLAIFFRNKAPARAHLHRYQQQELDCVKLIRMPPDCQSDKPPPFASVLAMLEDVFQCVRPLQLTVLDNSFKAIYGDDQHARELTDLITGETFWSDMEAVLNLVNLVKEMIHSMEVDRPLVSQCLPLWNDLKKKVKDWCLRYGKDEFPLEEVIHKRFLKNYHPAWSAAFILDPLYLVRDNSGRYLPPYKYLSTEQEKDVDRLITRLVAQDKAHIALMELMKWRSEGLDPLYAQAVQVKDRDPFTGRIKEVSPQSRRLVWETRLSEFTLLGKVAARLIFLHATSFELKCSWSLWRWAFQSTNPKLALERAEKMIYIASHAKLEQRNYGAEMNKGADLLTDREVEGIADDAFTTTPI